MLWDPFLIKNLLKNVICGTVNSTHMHCSQLTKSTIAGWKKKKKKKRKTWRRNVDVGFSSKQTVTKRKNKSFFLKKIIGKIKF